MMDIYIYPSPRIYIYMRGILGKEIWKEELAYRAAHRRDKGRKGSFVGTGVEAMVGLGQRTGTGLDRAEWDVETRR